MLLRAEATLATSGSAPPPDLRNTVEIVPACLWVASASTPQPHAGKRRMPPVLDLDPAIGPAAAIDALGVLRHPGASVGQPTEPCLEGGP